MRQGGSGVRLGVAGLAWLAGIACQLQQPALWAAAAYAGGFVASLVLVVGVAACAGRRGSTRTAALAAAALAIGIAGASFALAGWRATERLAEALPAALEGRDLVVTGTVASLPQRVADGVRLRLALDAEGRAVEGLLLPPVVALGWYGARHEDAAAVAPALALRAGDRWRFAVRLRRPNGAVNPHGFDVELRLFEQGVRATGYVRDAPAPMRLAQAVAHPVARARQAVRDAIEARIADPRVAGVLAALAIGDQGAIDRDDWTLFRDTGVAHLMSISGLHVTMFAWLAAIVVGRAWRLSARAMLRWPATAAARWGGVAAALGYAVLAGWGVPAQRTVWMLATVAALRSLGARWPWPPVLLAAAVVVTAIDPWAMTQPGFWLSFAAVGLLMASSPARPRGRAHDATTPAAGAPAGAARAAATLAGQGVRTQVVTTVGLAPLTLVVFQQVSAVGFAANLVAIPVVTLLVTPLALLGVLLPPLWRIAEGVLHALTAFLAALASLPGAVWHAPAAPAWAEALGICAAAVAVAPLPWRLRALAVLMAVPLVLPPRAWPSEGRFEVVAIDVGQGTAVLVRTRTHAMLFDAGPRYARDSDAGQRIVVPLLRALGATRLDVLVLSHQDLDHVGGAAAVLDALDVRRVVASLDAAHPLWLAAGERAIRCAAGLGWTWDGVDFAVLHPPPPATMGAAKQNAVSCVVRVASAGRSVLLAGDIEGAQEEALVAALGRDGLASDVLLVPHHGSRTSSSPAFLDAVAPAVAVVQAGYRNRYGHPAADVVARHAERGIEVRATPSCGAWWWPADRPAIGATCWRAASRRYWRRE